MAPHTRHAALPGLLDRRLDGSAYSLVEAAHYARVDSSTVRRWFMGERRERGGMAAVLAAARWEPRVSYLQLIEVAVIAALRQFDVPLEHVRRAHDYLRHTFGVDHPFARFTFATDGHQVLAGGFDRGFDRTLLAADAQGQLAWTDPMRKHFDDVDRELGLAMRWHPRGRDAGIVIDPRVAFGRPVVAASGTPTDAIRRQERLGLDDAATAHDFALDVAAVRAALAFERPFQDRSSTSAEADPPSSAIAPPLLGDPRVLVLDRGLGMRIPGVARAQGCNVAGWLELFGGDVDDRLALAEIAIRQGAFLTDDRRGLHAGAMRDTLLQSKVNTYVLVDARATRGRQLAALLEAWSTIRPRGTGPRGAGIYRVHIDGTVETPPGAAPPQRAGRSPTAAGRSNPAPPPRGQLALPGLEDN
jgi:uncharacterized protein (DUF433 family)